ncbi:hypothetical protein C4552_04210 [Candidatus Parcubacteria bacterium]|nr:MAG: hypothetical protein C4552_04210 [Candidatus Parcubacteria bacterium]
MNLSDLTPSRLYSCAVTVGCSVVEATAENFSAIIRMANGKPELEALCANHGAEAQKRGIPTKPLVSYIEAEERHRAEQARIAAERVRAKELDAYFAAALYLCGMPGCQSEPQPAAKMSNLILVGDGQQRRAPICMACVEFAREAGAKVFGLAGTIHNDAAAAREQVRAEAERELRKSRTDFLKLCWRAEAGPRAISNSRPAQPNGHQGGFGQVRITTVKQ